MQRFLYPLLGFSDQKSFDSRKPPEEITIWEKFTILENIHPWFFETDLRLYLIFIPINLFTCIIKF